MSPVPESGTVPETDAVVHFLREEFQPVKNQEIRTFVSYLPGIILLYILLDLLLSLRGSSADIMLLGWYVVAAVSLFLLCTLMKQVPEVLESLWTRGVIGSPGKRQDSLDKLLNNQPAFKKVRLWINHARFGRGRKTQDISAYYLDYLHEFQTRLNDEVGSSSSAILFTALIGWAILSEERFTDISFSFVLHFLVPCFMAFFIGLLLWRMFVISWQLMHFSGVFEISLQVRHPDKSGGLNPVGNLTFMIALVLTIPGILLSGWIIYLENAAANHYTFERCQAFCCNTTNKLTPFCNNFQSHGVCQDAAFCNSNPYFFDENFLRCSNIALPKGLEYNDFLCQATRYIQWLPNYKVLLLLIIVAAFIAFFIPVWKIHRDMVSHSYPLRQQIDSVSRMIDAKSRLLLGDLSEQESTERQKAGNQEPQLPAGDKPDKVLPVPAIPAVDGAKPSDTGPAVPETQENPAGADIETRNKEIEQLCQVYDQNALIPVWPFDRELVIKFLLSQAIPLLTLSGIPQTLIDVISSVIGGITP